MPSALNFPLVLEQIYNDVPTILKPCAVLLAAAIFFFL